MYPSPHGFPVLTEQAGGTLVHPGDGMRGHLFLSRTPGKLHLHLFLENVPQDQPFENEDVYRASCVELGFFDQERKIHVGIRADHDIDVLFLFKKGRTQAFGHTSHDGYQQLGILFLDFRETLYPATHALLGIFPHGAGVHQD